MLVLPGRIELPSKSYQDLIMTTILWEHGAGRGNRTLFYGLEDQHNNQYTIPAWCPRRDSNSQHLRSKRNASTWLGYVDMVESRGLEPQAYVGVNAHMIYISLSTSTVLLSMSIGG